MKKLDLSTVLVASDLGETSDGVLRAAAALASVAGARLRVLHVLELDATPYVEIAGLDTGFPGRIAAAERALEEQIGRVVGARVPVSGTVTIDTVHRALVSEAEGVGAGLIVLGPHRRRGAVDGLLGSTADRVVRGARVPSLVVRGELNLPLRRVVTPLDMSEPAEAALAASAQWCSALGKAAELRVVHVVPVSVAGDEISIGRAAIERALHENVVNSLGPDTASVTVTEEVVWGEQPAAGIVRYAQEQRADLVVLATHGRGAFKRLLIGSVASHVVRHASGPVLLVPPAVWKGDDG